MPCLVNVPGSPVLFSGEMGLRLDLGKRGVAGKSGGRGGCSQMY